MDGDTTEEDIDIPAHNTHWLARKMDSSRGNEVLAVPGQDEKSVHLCPDAASWLFASLTLQERDKVSSQRSGLLFQFLLVSTESVCLPFTYEMISS